MADPRNPYAPPNAPVADPSEHVPADADEEFVPNGQSVSVGRGLGWLGDAWQLFKARPGKWILVLILVIVFYGVLSWIPFANFLNALLWPFIGAGVLAIADRQRREGDFSYETLFDGFKRPAPLLILAVFFLLIFAALFASFAIVMGVGAATQFVFNTGRPAASVLASGFGTVMLIYLILALPIAAATYFAPALVVFHDLDAFTALKMSFIGSIKNILPGIVFAILALLFVMVSAIPLFLGLLVSLPVLMISSYTIYRDIFIRVR